jgi:hypothetical protein
VVETGEVVAERAEKYRDNIVSYTQQNTIAPDLVLIFTRVKNVHNRTITSYTHYFLQQR